MYKHEKESLFIPLHHSFHTISHSMLSHNNNNALSCKNTQNAPKLHIAYTKPDDSKHNIFSYFQTNNNTHNNTNVFPDVNGVERVCFLQTLLFNFAEGKFNHYHMSLRQSFQHFKKYDQVKKLYS